MSHHEAHHVIHAVKHGFEHLEFFGDGARAHELTEVVKQHALIGVGAGMIPIPGLDIAALVANVWGMYARINKVLDISFSENALKSIASGVLANIAAVLPGALIARVAGSFVKLIPGLGTIGGMAISAATNVAIMYVMGKVYIKSLEILVLKGSALTEDNLKKAAAEAAKDKNFVAEAYAEGKEAAKDAGK
jgi:uncharacterized protein (DUF697 family)